ncbi:THAP domain-containing protein 6-like [Diretmus argenteus]
MPHSCAAWSCTHRCTIQTRSRGITFHSFPKDNELRKQWEVALRREGFTASQSSRLCSEHFTQADFDRTGQTVRIRAGAIPSIFSFPAHLQRPVANRTTQNSKKPQESPSVDCSQPVHETEPLPMPNVDHSYALPPSPSDLRARLSEALARVESLEREKRNAKDRERRAKYTVCGLLEDLRGKNLINEELKERLDLYSDLPIHLLSKEGHEYTKDQREFALTLHLHGPKAYSYLRESLHLNLPHPHTLQRWMSSVDAKPGLNMMMLDMLKRRQEEDPAKYGCAYSPITSTTGQINWRYIVHLNDVQAEDGLHAANKMIDRLFDIMNSRNPRAKGFKAPLGSLNWAERVEFLLRGRDYLMSLVMKDGTPLHRSKRFDEIVKLLFA